MSIVTKEEREACFNRFTKWLNEKKAKEAAEAAKWDKENEGREWCYTCGREFIED